MAVSDVDLTPTESMARAAERGLQLREEHGRGGTEVGVARARDLKNRKTLSPSTVRRMHSFFSRHAVDKKGKGWESGSEGYPSAGLIAHLLWGGDPGASWAARKVKELDRAEGKSESSRGDLYSPMTVQRYDPDCPDSVCEPTMFSKSNTALILGIAASPAVFAAPKGIDRFRKRVEDIYKQLVAAGYQVSKPWHNADSSNFTASNKKGNASVNVFFDAYDGYVYAVATAGKKGNKMAKPFKGKMGSAMAVIQKALSFAEGVPSKNSMDEACWPGYEAIGTKVKDGKRVPNCVPKSESARSEASFDRPRGIKGNTPDALKILLEAWTGNTKISDSKIASCIKWADDAMKKSKSEKNADAANWYEDMAYAVKDLAKRIRNRQAGKHSRAVRREIALLMKDGYSQKQATQIALDMQASGEIE